MGDVRRGKKTTKSALKPIEKVYVVLVITIQKAFVSRIIDFCEVKCYKEHGVLDKAIVLKTTRWYFSWS